MSKSTRMTALLGFLRDWLKNCVIYWLLFCAVEYTHHGHYSWKKELIMAVILSPIIPTLRRVFYEHPGGIRPTKPKQPAV